MASLELITADKFKLDKSRLTPYRGGLIYRVCFPLNEVNRFRFCKNRQDVALRFGQLRSDRRKFVNLNNMIKWVEWQNSPVQRAHYSIRLSNYDVNIYTNSLELIQDLHDYLLVDITRSIEYIRAPNYIDVERGVIYQHSPKNKWRLVFGGVMNVEDMISLCNFITDKKLRVNRRLAWTFSRVNDFGRSGRFYLGQKDFVDYDEDGLDIVLHLMFSGNIKGVYKLLPRSVLSDDIESNSDK